MAAPHAAVAVARDGALALERVCMLERERRARIAAEDATRAREEILGVVSHDLGNPLGTIMIGVAALRRAATARCR